MKKEFKYPCAVETDSLVGSQGNDLQEAFIKLGAALYDTYREWAYYGVDSQGDTNYYSNICSFTDEDEEVILYTYDEIMSFVAELEQPKEAPVAKKQLKFPCAIAMSEITSQEVYDKVFNAFIEAGARDRENYNVPDDLGSGYEYFGVNSDQETIHWNNLEDYDADDCSNGYVAIYSLEDILGTIDPQEATSEPLGDFLADTPSVGINEGVEEVTEASEGFVIRATTDISITVNIKGSVFKLTRDEAHKLSNDLYSIFEDEIV